MRGLAEGTKLVKGRKEDIELLEAELKVMKLRRRRETQWEKTKRQKEEMQ